ASSFGCYSFFFCFLIIRRPPTPTLFPYTTLFRSYNSQKYYYKSTIIGGSIIGLYNPVNEIQISAEFEENNVSIDWDNRTGFANEDRKSTRLNSSHVKISYAVFCLKKKKKKKSKDN